MTTMTQGIKCAHCKAYHPSVEAVRQCAVGGSAPVVVPEARVAAATATAPSNSQPATEKQVAFIRRLATERSVSILPHSHNADNDINPLGPVMYGDLDHLSKRAASKMIEDLLAMPKPTPATHPQAAPKAEPLTDGMYRKDEVIYKIQKAVHGSGHLYAKRLVPGDGYGAKATFVYAPGAMKALTLADRMTLAEAKEWGALYGTCCVCGRTLTNEQSIEAGIGPVCAGKGMWA